MAAQWRGVTLVMFMVRIDMKRMTIVLVGDVDKYDEDPHPRIVCSHARACVLFQQLSHPEMFKSLIKMLLLFNMYASTLPLQSTTLHSRY